MERGYPSSVCRAGLFLWLLLLFAVGMAPAQSGGSKADPSSLIDRLGAIDVGRRIIAVEALRESGDEGREALERFLAPHLFPVSPAEAPDEARISRIRELIEELAADDYEVRQRATNLLVEQGLPALPFLEEATGAEDPETRIRASLVIESIALKGFHEQGSAWTVRREAVRALVTIASPLSIPVLLFLLDSNDQEITILADLGLRMVVPRWADEEELLRGTDLVVVWNRAIERVQASDGMAVQLSDDGRLRFPLAEPTLTRARTIYDSRVTGAMSRVFRQGARTTICEEEFQDRVLCEGREPVVAREYSTHDQPELPGLLYRLYNRLGGRPRIPVLENRRASFPLVGNGQITVEGIGSDQSIFVETHRGLSLSSVIPGGEFVPGQSMEVDFSSLGLVPLPVLSGKHDERGTHHFSGRITFLGIEEDGGLRFRVLFDRVLEPCEREEPTRRFFSHQRMWGAGDIVLDPAGRVAIRSEFRIVQVQYYDGSSTTEEIIEVSASHQVVVD